MNDDYQDRMYNFDFLSEACRECDALLDGGLDFWVLCDAAGLAVAHH